MRKKVVWLPYDFDTAIGINNEGALTFSYNLEDTDKTESGADVYNGQNSVMWNNLRDAFGDELMTMYKQLRSDGVLSYELVEKMFEEHQEKWPEAIFNEDAAFKYIIPLTNPEDGKPTGAYLSMLQGSKADQRKWWLYNRFRYIDSKYNAGDALSDVIQLRGYAKANITVTPYADIYPSVKYGSYLVQKRGARGVESTLVCPLDNVNDTEIYIYSASQLSSVGDLSGLMVGFADFSMGTKLQNLKIGDSSSTFENKNLNELYVGTNTLLKTLDVRNCTALGTGDMRTVDVSGCSNIEELYFDNTKIQGLTLPDGGVIRKLHLPSTMINLTILNQKNITDFTLPSYSNISTLRLENVSSTINEIEILRAIPANARVRLIGLYYEAADAAEISGILDLLDGMRGLDENGNNVEKAQVSGTIHTSSLTGAEIASFNERYPYLTVAADHTSSVLRYYNGSTLVQEETILDGGDGTYTGTTPTKSQDAQYTYTFAGWSKGDDNTVDSDALTNVVADRNVYACYTGTLRKYTAIFVRASVDGGGTLYTQIDIPYGTMPTYGGVTPTTIRGNEPDYTFNGWKPALSGITGDTTYTAAFLDNTSVARRLITKKIDTVSNNKVISIGAYAFAGCYYLENVDLPAATSIGVNAFYNCKQIKSVSFPLVTTIEHDAFNACSNLESADFPLLASVPLSCFSGCFMLKSVNLASAKSISTSAFVNCKVLTTVNVPEVETVANSAFSACEALEYIDLPAVKRIEGYAFYNCKKLKTVILRSDTMVKLVNYNAFTTSSNVVFYVPDDLVDSYKTDSIWKAYATRIKQISELPTT